MQTPKSLGITPTQFKNLAKLTIFVRDKVAPPKFDINSFFQTADLDTPDNCVFEKDYECGTTACFCGYGPLAGIKPRKGEDWWQYGGRVFGADEVGNLWYFLFSNDHKNSKAAAVKRGAYFLMNGLPLGNHDRYNLGAWETPRSFKPDWAEIEKIANA